MFLTIFRIGLLVLAIGFQAFWLVEAAPFNRDDYVRLRDQVQQIDQKQQALALAIETRLVRVETILDAISKAVWGIGIATVLQLIQAVTGLVFGARRNRPADLN